MYSEDIIQKYLGGLAEGGILLLSYNQYSLGWRIGITYVKHRLEQGDFALFVDFTLPVSRFIDRLKSVGLDAIKEGEKGNLVIINAFDEKDLGYNFVYPIDADLHTLISKLGKIKRKIAEKYNLKERRCIGIAATLDMIHRRWGNDTLKNLLIRTMTTFERLQLEGYKASSILIVNRDALPRDLHSWLITLSDQVIITRGELRSGTFIETIAIIKDNKPDFEPKTMVKEFKPTKTTNL